MTKRNMIDVVVILADGTEHVVRPTLEDTLAFETTLRKNRNWGDLKDSALKMTPFRAWNCMRRQGLTDLTWDQFTTGDTAALSVHSRDDDEDEGDDNLAVEGLGKGGRKAPSTSSQSASQSASEAARSTGDEKASS